MASGNPTTLEEIGFTTPKTKQRIPIEVAKAIVDTATRVMTAEQRDHIITDTSNPLKAIAGYKQAKSTSILKARYEGIRAGIKRQREVVVAKKAGQGGNPLPDTDDDVVLLRSLEQDRKELDKLVNGGK